MPLIYGSYKIAWKWLKEGIWDRIFKALASMRRYDGFKHKKGSKIHVCVNENSMPLRIILGSGNGHNSKRFNELLEGLNKIPKELYADSSYNKEIRNKLSLMNIEANIPVNPRNGRKPIS